MDYYGSIIQTKDQIYKEIRSRYSEHNADYIDSKLDRLYETNFISEEVSVSGWSVFVGPEVVRQLDELLEEDLKHARQRLNVARCLLPAIDTPSDTVELPLDIIEHIASFPTSVTSS